MGIITFLAERVTTESMDGKRIHVTLEADMKVVVEDMDIEDRLHEIEPVDIVTTLGAPAILGAMCETHFDQWVRDGGDYYEALNAIGIERIQEWIESYTGGE